jgi:hypothetical protein
MTPNSMVFLVDVDDTLLDNDPIRNDLRNPTQSRLVIPALSSGTGLSSSHTTWDVVRWDSTIESKPTPSLATIVRRTI